MFVLDPITVNAMQFCPHAPDYNVLVQLAIILATTIRGLSLLVCPQHADAYAYQVL